MPTVPPEGARGSELSQLVADHILGDIDGDKPLSVVDGDGMTNELREDDGTPRPSAEDTLLHSTIHGHDAF
jgi:hypothetical protein